MNLLQMMILFGGIPQSDVKGWYWLFSILTCSNEIHSVQITIAIFLEQIVMPRVSLLHAGLETTIALVSDVQHERLRMNPVNRTTTASSSIVESARRFHWRNVLDLFLVSFAYKAAPVSKCAASCS
jgi:hypothetical protein